MTEFKKIFLDTSPQLKQFTEIECILVAELEGL